MSASLRLRIGVVAAGLSCLLLGYAAAQQGQTAGEISTTPSRGTDANASGQIDRSSGQQTERSTAPNSEVISGSTAQRSTADYRGAHAAVAGPNQAVDHYLAGCLLAKNEAEVQLSELAQQKSENAEVKQFAQKMIQDHRKMIEQLQPLAGMQGGANRQVPGAFGAQSEAQGRSEATEGRSTDTTALPGSSGATQTISPSGTIAAAPRIGTLSDATAARNAAGSAPSGVGNGALHQLMQIERQIGERCLQATRDEMQQRSGAEFDKCYVGNAISAHVHALAELQVIGQQTQGTLAQVAQQAQPTVQQHLEQAKQLMKQLEGQSTSSGSQAERQSTRTER